jgi:hypothetical protein
MLLATLTHQEMETLTNNHILYIVGELLSNVLALFFIKLFGYIMYTSGKLSATLLIGLFLTSIVVLMPVYIVKRFHMIWWACRIRYCQYSLALLIGSIYGMFHFLRCC